MATWDTWIQSQNREMQQKLNPLPAKFRFLNAARARNWKVAYDECNGLNMVVMLDCLQEIGPDLLRDMRLQMATYDVWGGPYMARIRFAMDVVQLRTVPAPPGDLPFDQVQNARDFLARATPSGALIIGINPSAIKFGEVNAGDNPGHTIVALADSSGSVVKVFSYGPTELGAGAALACSAPGRTGYHLLANDQYNLYEFPVTNDQSKRAEAKMKDIDGSPGTFSGTHQCTTTSLEVVEAAGVSAPLGRGNIKIPLCNDAKGVSAPAFLDRELEAQFLKAGKPIKRVQGSYFRGFVDIQDK